jgi:hypothetical protein
MVTFLCLIGLGLGNPPSPALLHCSEPSVAKGNIKGGPPLVQTFELTNRSSETLTITKVEAGCGCVKRTLSAMSLKPSEAVRLTVEINTLTQSDGPNRWQAVVSYATGQEKGELILTVTANLSREVTVTPPQLGISTTGETTQVLTVTDRRRKALSVVKAVGSMPHLTAQLDAPKLEADGTHSQKITLKLSADAPVGQRDEVLVMQTDDPAYPEFRVPVRILKKAPGAMAVAPEEISVRLGTEEVSTLVQLRAPDGKNIRIESAASDSPSVTVKYSSTAGPVATVRVTVAAAPSGSCRVKLRLAEPTAQEVIIPVSWAVATKK